MTASIIINIALAISNIVVFFIQRTTIKHLRLRNAELEKTNKASLDLSEGTNKTFAAYKEALKVEDIEAHINFKVAMKLPAAVDEVIAETGKALAEDSKILERATALVSEDLLKFCHASMQFTMFIIYQLNFTEDAIKATAKNFFKEHPNAERMMMEEMVRLKLKYPNGISQPEKQIVRSPN